MQTNGGWVGVLTTQAGTTVPHSHAAFKMLPRAREATVLHFYAESREEPVKVALCSACPGIFIYNKPSFAQRIRPKLCSAIELVSYSSQSDRIY